ncbi:glycosyltransferase family 2 protein [Psychrosphaera aestuarii]|uniref:glycosyltransferase family 2 protein n=1 Tax=Psychrosphaera aestuarii TaxID=1266052 RepID=UPI001B31A281|nr:glycosyltransferase family 2 protein [Psychrosphaera aestuarii]
MKFSIIMPAYNAEKFIDIAIKSVTAQEYPLWELIIVNDGSTDSTLDKVKAWAKEEPRIIYLNQNNGGKPSIARNNGLKRATGEYICFLDADDTYEPSRLAQCQQFFLKNPVTPLWFSDFSTINEQGNRLENAYLNNRDFLEKALEKRFDHLVSYTPDTVIFNKQFLQFMACETTAIHTITICIKSSLLKDGFGFDDDLTIGEDLDLWFRLVSNNQIGYCPQALSQYRINPNSITKQNEKMLVGTYDSHIKNLTRYKQLLTSTTRSLYKKKISQHASHLGFYYRQQRLLKTSFHYYLQALKLNPSVANILNIIKLILFIKR